MIKDKRDNLERFISEQILGPGVSGYRFVDIQKQILIHSTLDELEPIKNENELINIVPAAVYSTGVLFPVENKNNTKAYSIPQLLINNETIEPNDGEDFQDSQDSSDPNLDDKDGIQVDQMYPKSMGFSCCLDEKILKDGKIDIKIRARYYKKQKRDTYGEFHRRYGVLCEIDKDLIHSFLQNNNLNEYFYFFDLGSPSFITILLIKHLSNDIITKIKTNLRGIQKQIAEKYFEDANKTYKLDKLKKESIYLSNLKSTIFYELKANVIDDSKRNELYNISQEIEIIENIVSHLNDLLDISGGGYGLWRSEIIERLISLENIDFPAEQRKRSFLYQDDKKYGLKDIFRYFLNERETDKASLSINIQLSRDSRKAEKKIYLKVQLINTSTQFEVKADDKRYYSTFNEKVNEKCFFGVKLSLTNSLLIPYNQISIKEVKDQYSEDETTQYIYRQFEDYGVGHGCSVKWNKISKTIETEYIPVCDTPDVDPTPRNKKNSPTSVDNEYIAPLFLENAQTLQFKWLSIFSEAENEEIIKGLNLFVDAYNDWIEIKKKKYEKKIEPEKAIAFQELKKCEVDQKRMKNNIDIFLSGDKNRSNLKSFRLMNAAMFMQLWHSVNVKNDRVKNFFNSQYFIGFNLDFYKNTDDKLFSPYLEPAAWRAFQLAFILLNLDGIFHEENDKIWEKRNEWVDLVWFPTGGGKTEAYLGIIALTIINRRILWNDKGGGTAAIMRYTLRLLTLQQFQRATLVIMALELMRRWGGDQLGNEPIFIGLWVGNNSLPNKMLPTNKDDKDNLLTEYVKLFNGKESKIPFDNCPWCKSKLRPSFNKVNNPQDYFLYNRLPLYCDNNKCSFTEPDFFDGDKLKGLIPVSLCDEEIYQHPPTLLFGTVDKFAQLAHKVSSKNGNKDSRRIFGRGNWEDGKPKDGYLPPDLIIQDELHLLLGPLGSAVALFESAIDQLSQRKDGTRPKIISSTATTRNTAFQIIALFDRHVNIFPKPGVECDDSFFAFYKRRYLDPKSKDSEYISKRRYIGILPTGRTQIWMQMRLAAILMTHRAIFELQQLGDKSPLDFQTISEDFIKAMDYYHTIVSYFNSLKEVGKTESQIQSYILKEIRRVFNRVIRPQKLMHSIYTYGPIQEAELTGRLSGEEVKNELKRVDTKWNAEKRFAHIVTENDINRKEIKKTIIGNVPPEFVVATNMISVGIDVSRFNTIIMNSMPRSISEYIQASSRVARDSYGLVIMVHHPFRARDISHYEKFVEFHEKMYSYVEPISITPFTLKAVDRYLGLYLATMLRHTTEFVERDSASRISQKSEEKINALVDQLSKYFIIRKQRLPNYDILINSLIKQENVENIKHWIEEAINDWKEESNRVLADGKNFVFNKKSNKAQPPQEQLYVDIDEYEGNIHSDKWQVPMSLRVIEPEAAIKIYTK